MKLSKTLYLGFAASALFTIYSGVQSAVYYSKMKSNPNYISAVKFAELSSLVSNADNFIRSKEPWVAQAYLDRAERKIGDLSVIDDYLRAVKVALRNPSADYEYQINKLNMVKDELNDIQRSYLSQSGYYENIKELSQNWSNFKYSLLVSSLIALALSFSRAKRKNVEP